MSASKTEHTTPDFTISYDSFIDEADANIFESLYETALGERVFEAINGHAFDKVGSAALYAKTFGEAWLKEENKLLVFVGCDGGLLLQYLQQSFKAEGSKVIVIELPELIEWIEDNVTYDKSLIELLPANGDLRVMGSEKYQAYLYRNSIDIRRSLATLDQYHPAYARLWLEYEQLLNRFFFSNMMEIHGSAGFVNAQIINIADNKHSIHHLYHRFEGGVAIILAGGPSLDESIDWVKAHRDEVTVFAVGRVCARLLREGIDPDFICAVDPNDISFDNSKHLLSHYKKATFLYAYHVNPRLLSQWCSDRAFYHGRRYPWIVKEPDADQQFSAPGPTVTNTLLSFVTHMGFETVVFAGVDLCFKADGQSHESGSIETQVGRFIHQGTQFVKTNAGTLAPTSSDFFTAQQVLEAQVYSIKIHFPKMVFFNPSPNAAFVEGVNYVEWSALSLPEWRCDAAQIVDSVLADNPVETTEFLDKTHKEVAKMRAKLSKVIVETEQGKKATDKLFDTDEAIPRRTKQVLKARSAIERQLKDNIPILIDYAPSMFHDALLTDLQGKQDKEDIKLSLTRYFSAISDSAALLLSLLDHGLSLIRLRQQESRCSVLTSELVDNWMRFGQPGRLYVWLSQQGRAADSLSDSEKELAYPVIRAYEAIFKNAETGIEKKFKDKVYDNTLDSVRNAMLSVSDENIIKLDEVLRYCEDNAATDSFYRDLGFYILGYFNKLRNEPDEAYKIWAMVEHKSLQLIVYKDYLNLALLQNNYEEAMTVLQKLCVLDRRFLTVYANLLITIGQKEFAIEVLEVYLKEAHDDVAAQLQLARLYMEKHDMEKARQYLDRLYKSSPTNPIVQRLLIEAGGHVEATKEIIL